METTRMSRADIQNPRADDIRISVGYGANNEQSTLFIGPDLSLIVGGQHATPDDLMAEAQAMVKLAAEARRLSVWCEQRAETLRRGQAWAASA